MNPHFPSDHQPPAQTQGRFLSFFHGLVQQFRQASRARRGVTGLLLVALAAGLLIFPLKQIAQQQNSQDSGTRVDRTPENSNPTAAQIGSLEADGTKPIGDAGQFTQRTRDKANLPSQRYSVPVNSLPVSYGLPQPTAAQLRPTASRQIGFGRAINLASTSTGQVFRNSDGTQIRLIALQSPDAVELRVHLADFDLPPGDEVYIYGLDKESPVAGPYTNRGPLAVVSETKGAQSFWSDTIPGDTVIIEHFSSGATKEGISAFTVADVMHNFQSFLTPVTPQVLNCHLDAKCTNDNNNNASAKISYVKNGLQYVCSGTMMNDLQGANGELAPYFLTANHCVNTATVAATVQALWFYQSTACNSGIAASGTASPTGSTILNTEQVSDQTLLRILYNVPSLWYSGWNANAQANNTAVYGVHHPDGSYLRRSAGSITNTATACGDTGLASGYRVAWTSGNTEGGSSGSGLRLTNGQLTGVDSCGYCNLQPDGSCTPFCGANAIYGKFSDFYTDIQNYMETGDYGVASPLPPYLRPQFSFGRTLSNTSPPSRTKGVGFYGDSYGNFNGVAGQRITIAVNSTAFDPVIYLLSPVQRRLIAVDDDGGPGTNSLINIILPDTGEYILHVTTFSSGTTGAYSASAALHPPAADFDGDVKTDVSIWRPSTGVWWMFNSATNTFTTRQWGFPTDLPVPGDYDGDGKIDTAIWRPSDGTWWMFNSSTNTYTTRQWGFNGDIPVPADYDNDGRTDVAIWRPSTGVWWIFQSSTNNFTTRQWGFPTDVPVPGDFDGDGKADTAIWRPSDGTWWIFQSSTNTYTTRQWGFNGDIPLKGDFDGDGRNDIAIWRPSNGTWWVFQSSTSTFITRQWGFPTDVPVPGDYDRDGKWDTAVFRPSDGTWWIFQSSTNTYRTQQWGFIGDVPLPSK